MSSKDYPVAASLGLLILRLGLGAMFIWHGYGKISGGPELWIKLGQATSVVGINVAPKIFGFLAAFSEFGGGICMVLGFLMRPACLMMAITMTVATIMHLAHGDGLNVASHAIEVGIVFYSLILIGPGRLSLDELKKG
jgi:putative oxidoreductase